MERKIPWTVFATVFNAELGDKTQLAMKLFASNREVSKPAIFTGASLALIATSAIGFVAGGLVSQHVGEKFLHYLAGAGFIGIGIWPLLKT